MARKRNRPGEGKYYASVRKSSKSTPDGLLKLLIKQKYHVVGEHSAAKLCHWAGSALTGGGGCYKNRFYGIASHRCLQCTPVLLFCNHACIFCWRFMPERGKYGKVGENFSWDEPEKIADGLIAAQKEIVSGYGGNKKASGILFHEARSPKHVALSLTGEPAMYPHLGRLLEEFHKRGMTTFLVTNGTFPERVGEWKAFPTQFYVSMVAPNEAVYLKAIRPQAKDLWKKYLRMLELMPEIGKKTRTVLRMTIARGVNDTGLEGYASQIKIAQPHYVEVKSFVFVGGARQPERKLSLESMLSMEEVRACADALARMTGYAVSDWHVPSRVVLLSRDKKTEKNRMIKWR